MQQEGTPTTTNPGMSTGGLGGQLWNIIFDPTDIIEVRGFQGDAGKRVRWFGFTHQFRNGLSEKILNANSKGFDLYQGVNPRPMVGAGKSADITTFRTLCVDLDPDEEAGEESVCIDEALYQLSRSGLPEPSVILDSGRGIHFYWKLIEAITDSKQWRLAQKSIIGRFRSSDKRIHDPARVMRMPGTINYKNGRTTSIIDANTSAYPVSLFLKPMAVPEPKPQHPAAPPADRSPDALNRARLYVGKIPQAQRGHRNAEAFKIACVCLCDFALDVTESLGILTEWNNRNQEPIDQGELLKTFKSAQGSARGRVGAKNRDLPKGAGGNGVPQPPAKTTPNNKTLDVLARDCALIIGTTQVWHEGLVMSMEIAALRALYPIEGPIWLKAADKRTVRNEDIVFEPCASKVGPGQINLWRGLTITPDPRPCPLLVAHLQHVCGGDKAAFEWVCKWMAYPLQHPGAKMDSALIFQGPQGTGKSMAWRTYREIFGEYGRKITQSTLEDPYTGWMSRKCFVVAEEVCSTRTQARKLRNLLKDWVTGESFEIREKYQIGRTERALANFVFLSNEDVPLPIDTGDRRFGVFLQNEKKYRAYFDALGAEIEDNGPARLYAWLLSIDLGDFNEHSAPPDTEAKEMLKELCAHSYELFLEEWSTEQIPDLPFVSATLNDLYTSYQFWCRHFHGTHADTKRQFGKYLAGRLDKRYSNEVYIYVDNTDTTRFNRALKGFISMCDGRKL